AVLLSGGYVNRFSDAGRSYKVIPQVGDEKRATPEQLLELKVRTRNGGRGAPRSLGRPTTGDAPPAAGPLPQRHRAQRVAVVAPRVLSRFQQRNAAKVFGVVAPGVTKEEALSALEKAAKEIVPPNYAIDYAGESRQMRTEGTTLVSTLGFAIGLIYLVLAAQF